MQFLRAVALASFVWPPGGAFAATLHGASSWHVFGDSFSDAGRAYRLSFGLLPDSPPYWKGRFSDGPVWAERIENAFSKEGLPASNQAYGGAQAVRNRDAIPDIGLQARTYSRLPSRNKGDAPMAAVLAGGNDLLRANRADVRNAGRAAADEVAATARYLTRQGVTQVLLINMPDLGRLPRYAAPRDADRAAAKSLGARAFNVRLDRRIDQMRADGLTVRSFDLYGAFGALLDDPGAFGFTDATEPCLVNGRRCGKRAAAGKVFFDDIHPTTAAHRLLAGLILDDLARPAAARTLVNGPIPAGGAASPTPVPAPAPAALLLTGLGALVFAARRNRLLRIPRLF